jgi:hypothetical protein
MTRLQELWILEPLTRGWVSEAVSSKRVEELRGTRYLVTLAVPGAAAGELRTRTMEGWELHDYMRLHAGELAEFIVSVKPLQTSARLSRRTNGNAL